MEQGSPDPERQVETEPTVSEVLERAIAEGYVEQEDLEYFGDDLADVLTNVTDYILQSGDDPDEVFARWGVTVESEEQPG